MAEGENHLLLLYTYVEGMAQRRVPFRDAHLARILYERNTGHIAMAGGFDPPTGGAIVFHGVDRDHVERFVQGDPYYLNGLITAYRIEHWRLVGEAPRG